MPVTVGKYTFSSWLRKGIGITINQTDTLGVGASSVTERATIPVDVKVNSRSVPKEFALIGPGDIVGINPHMIVRTEPLNQITNFEPNYLAFIEFYDEDFIWRYTPARANGDKLRPWILLAVLKEGKTEDENEFEVNERSLPLPSLTVKSAASLPKFEQSWAWGHVHTNDGYNNPGEFEQFLQSLHDLNNPDADKIISRLMCPRKLEPNTAYRAFLIPAFETGRLAGLGRATQPDTDAQAASYGKSDQNKEFPIYYQWYFRTGSNEDFEYLVRLLEPRVMDKKLGIRDMDGSKPGFGITKGTDIGIIPDSQNQMIIGLEGALKSPDTASMPVNLDRSKFDDTDSFFSKLTSILNFPAELLKTSNNSVDPVVCPPIYGENHAGVYELKVNDDGWLHVLNKDPRNRVSSGFGTNVIQKNQDSYVARAWAQVQKILEANRRILFASFAMTFAQTIKDNFISKLKPEETLVFFSPLLKKVKGSSTTLYHQMRQSNVPTAAVSVTLRRIIRPRGPYFEKLKTVNGTFTHRSLISDLNSKTISAAPPKQVPEGITRIDKVADGLPKSKILPILKIIFKFQVWISILLLVVFIVLAVLTGNWAVYGPIVVAVIAAYTQRNKFRKLLEDPGAFTQPDSLADAIQATPPQGSFKFMETDPVIGITSTATTQVTSVSGATSSSAEAPRFTTVTYYTSRPSGQDSLEAANFRKAATAFNKRFTVKTQQDVKATFDVDNAFQKISTATDPKVAFPRQLASLVKFSFDDRWLLDPEKLIPAMAYPDFEDPMYEKLRDISSELLIPNLHLIPPNTISLLVTNPVFIESYMVGLNHEFGRELLWREYPTDQRGSYFRQFWDVKGIIAPESTLSKEQITEKYKDITPLDQWKAFTSLGSHNNRPLPDPAKKQLVFVVRGELLKKYPNTIVYAQKAHRNPDPTEEPTIKELDENMMDQIRFPLFKAEIAPDIKFFGFDLTIAEAEGDDNPQKEEDDWGYYFIIQQIPGEPRFGMDVTFAPDDPGNVTWDDLSWDKYNSPEGFIDTGKKPELILSPSSGGSLDQWGKDSAMMASILYQKPVMIAVHAKEMLNKLTN